MSCINVDLNYFTHPKTLRLVGLLGRGAEVLPLKLWTYCGRFAVKTGRLTGHSEQEIEKVLEWWGKPGCMIPAMITVGYLGKVVRKSGTEYYARGWQEHQGHLDALKERNKKVALNRWDNIRRSGKDSGSTVGTSGTPAVTRDVPAVYPNQPSIPLEKQQQGGEMARTWKDFVAAYPDHRRDAAPEIPFAPWEALSQQDKTLAFSRLKGFVASWEWMKENRQFVPGLKKFIIEARFREKPGPAAPVALPPPPCATCGAPEAKQVGLRGGKKLCLPCAETEADEIAREGDVPLESAEDMIARHKAGLGQGAA